jgi:hypothetical protein
MTESQTRSIDIQTDNEAAFVAQALDYDRAVKRAGQEAPVGQFLNHAEKATLEGGRELMRSTLERITQEGIDEVEKKSDTRLCPTCQRKTRHLGYRHKTIATATGPIRPKRRYQECGPCHVQNHPADALIGLEDYTVGFRFLAVRAGSRNSFEAGKEDLKAYCGLDVSHMTIRTLCYLEAAKVEVWLKNSEDVPKDFIAASGNVEVTLDATKVNTTEGWRDAKVCIFSKRKRGESALPAHWDKRSLPKPEVRVAFAAVEKKDGFQERVNGWRCRLHVGSKGDISGLGDGAEWIWNIVHDVFGSVRECLDVYHALENLSKTGKVLYGEGTEEYQQWQEATKWELLESGFERLEKRLDGLDEEFKDDGLRRKELVRIREYLANHRSRLCYRERLLEGRAIGSGQVEGACKSMIGKRLKQTNARWLEDRLDEMAVLCSVHYSDLWKKYWLQAN